MKQVSAKRAREITQEKHTREALLIECKGYCMECGGLPDWRGLSLHHENFKSRGGKSEYSNVRLLCGKCHSQFHGIREK